MNAISALAIGGLSVAIATYHETFKIKYNTFEFDIKNQRAWMFLGYLSIFIFFSSFGVKISCSLLLLMTTVCCSSFLGEKISISAGELHQHVENGNVGGE